MDGVNSGLILDIDGIFNESDVGVDDCVELAFGVAKLAGVVGTEGFINGACVMTGGSVLTACSGGGSVFCCN